MWIALGCVFGYYLAMPIIAYLRRQPLGGTIDPQWYADDTPRESLAATETALERIGFSPPTRVSADGARGGVAHMSVLRHKDETTVATVAMRSLIFRSHRTDGRVMITTNQTARLFPSMPYHDSIRCATIRDPVALWRVHQRRLQHAPVGAAIADGDVVGYVNREARRFPWTQIANWRDARAAAAYLT